MTDIVPTNNNAIANASDFNIPRGYICTLDITELAGKLKLVQALNGAVSMKDKVNEVLRVVNVVTTKGTRVRTEEECVNVYLICEDGTVYFTQSEGIARAISIIVGVFTDPITHTFMNPVEQGVGMQVKEQTMANGNTLKTIIPVEL